MPIKIYDRVHNRFGEEIPPSPRLVRAVVLTGVPEAAAETSEVSLMFNLAPVQTTLIHRGPSARTARNFNVPQGRVPAAPTRLISPDTMTCCC